MIDTKETVQITKIFRTNLEKSYNNLMQFTKTRKMSDLYEAIEGFYEVKGIFKVLEVTNYDLGKKLGHAYSDTLNSIDQILSWEKRNISECVITKEKNK